MRFALLALISVLFSSQVAATQPKCFRFHDLLANETSKPVHHPEVEIRAIQGSTLSSRQNKLIRTTLDELAQLAGERLKLPANLKIEVSPPGDWADYFDGTIHIPENFKAVVYGKNPKITASVLSHEWGHSLFELNLEERFPLIASARREAKTDLASFRTIYSPYNEFFADVVAVMHAKDGKATRDPLFSSARRKAGNADAIYRDFTAGHRAEGWKAEGLYSLLSPARAFVWEAFLSRPKAQAFPERALEAILNSIGNEIAFRLQHPETSLGPDEINHRLIREMKARFEEISW